MTGAKRGLILSPTYMLMLMQNIEIDFSKCYSGPPYRLATSSSSRWSFKSEVRFFISVLWLSISFLTSSIIIFLTFPVLSDSFCVKNSKRGVTVGCKSSLRLKLSVQWKQNLRIKVKRFLCPCIFQFLIPLSLKLLAYH